MTIYSISGENKNTTLKKIIEVNDQEFRFEQITWSKLQNYFCLFDKKGNFKFGILKEKTTKEKGSHVEITKYEIEMLSKDCNVGNSIQYANWDPSGRFMAVFCERDNRVSVFNNYGDSAFSLDEAKSTQFIWRPRRQVMISSAEMDQIKKNNKKLYDYYNEEDDKILNEKEYLEKQKIKAKHDTFQKFMNLGRKRWDELQEQRV